MYGGNVSGCSSAYNYEAAHRLFSNTPLPGAKSRGRSIWSDNERPLDDVRKHHYRIVQGPNALWYDMVLYRTAMARYHRPTTEGRAVLYTNDSRSTSSSFMWQVIRADRCKMVTTTDGRHVASPLYTHDVLHDPWTPPESYDGAMFSSALWFDPDGRLDVSKSQHTPHVRRVASPEDKAKRAALKAKMANLLFMAQLRMPEFERSVDIDYYKGRPFGNPQRWGGRSFDSVVRDLCAPAFNMATLTPDYTDAFFGLAQEVYSVLASKRAYGQAGGASYTRRGNMPSGIDELEKPITPEEFLRSLTNKLVTIAGLDYKTGKEPLPQFMPWDEYPRTTAEAA